jgi:two-component system, response regulator YesN
MYTILTVDDEAIVKLSLKKIIESMGEHFRVIGDAENGRDALELVNKYSPDLVITDICMPVMDGLEFIEEVKRSNQKIEFIILSGYDEFQYAQTALRNGAADFLLKPIKPDQLKNTLKQIYDKFETGKKDFSKRSTWLWKYKTKAQQLAVHIWNLEETKLYNDLEELHKELLIKDQESLPLKVLYTDLLTFIEREIEQRENFELKHKPSQTLIWPDQPRLVYEMFVSSVLAIMEEIRETRNLGCRHLLLRALEYVEQNFTKESLTLKEVAASVEMSPGYFSHTFKDEIGVSFIQYLTKLRMEKAKRMLNNPLSKTYEIAYNVGYNDYPHFSKTFKKHFGLSPSELRKRIGINR